MYEKGKDPWRCRWCNASFRVPSLARDHEKMKCPQRPEEDESDE